MPGPHVPNPPMVGEKLLPGTSPGQANAGAVRDTAASDITIPSCPICVTVV